jgi:predicted transcriptional regulator
VIEDLSHEDLARAVDRAVEDLLEAARAEAPPVDAVALARTHLGLAVRVDDQPERRGRTRRPAAPREIVLPPGLSEERRQWAVAQEIGARLKPAVLEQLGLAGEKPRGLLGESLANLLAQRVLVPSCWFAAEARACAYDLLDLKKVFATAGPEVIAWRWLDLSVPCIVTILDNDHIQRRRSNAWRVKRELSAPERRCQRYVSHYSRPQLLQEDGWTVQGWPVHQADWKREILRSVIDREDEGAYAESGG